MRPRNAAFAATAAATLVFLVAGERGGAQEPAAQARAEAAIASGDLGVVGRAAVQDSGREGVTDAASRTGMTIGSGETTVSASRRGGTARAQAVATAGGVSLFDGFVTADRVTRSATARDSGVRFAGSVAGLVVDGEPQGDVGDERSWSAAGARVTANTDGAGLRVRLTRAVAGFASGTTVVIAEVSAEAVDGADPAVTATPEPTAVPQATPERTPGETTTEDPAAERRQRAAERRERAAKRREARAKRREAAQRRLADGRFVFPVYGDARVADDFGAARQIGAHEGNDVFAAFGSPVLAVADGTLNRVGTLPISGNRLWLETDRGDSFFYAHLSAFGPEAVSGRRVRAGTLLGFTGNTGDAEPTPPHVHFEIHPGDRKSVDPHEILLAWQEDGELPAGGWLARYGEDTEARPGALVEVRDFIAGE
jgi:murein DD-endopeptidase MepM/ murein hydrolase activator NlpD